MGLAYSFFGENYLLERVVIFLVFLMSLTEFFEKEIGELQYVLNYYFYQVCERLGIDKKKSYSRLYSICLRVGMHIQAESHKKTRVFRVWTSGNAGSECSDLFPEKVENRSWENNVPTNDFGTPHDTGGLAQTSIEHSLAISDADFATPARLTDSESNSGVPDCSPSNAKRRNVLTRRNLQESFHEICDKVVDTAMGSPDLALSETNYLALPKPAKPKVHQPQPITVENSRRERRILERLNVLTVLFYRCCMP